MKKLSTITIATLLIAAFAWMVAVWAQDTTYGPKVYRTDGGNREVVANNGTIDVEPGGYIKLQSGSLLAPDAAGNATVGNAAKPFSSLYLGNAATNGIQITGTSNQATVITVPGNISTLTVSGLLALQCGNTASCSNTDISATARLFAGSANLVAGTSVSNVTVGSFSPAFTNNASFQCLASAINGAGISIAVVNSSSILLSQAANSTITVNYMCVGK